MKIRKATKKDLEEVAILIRKTFKRFNSKGESKRAVRNYLSHFSTKKENFHKLKKNFSDSPLFFVAEESKKIIGVIRGRPNRIFNLFVDSNYHKKGVGRRLVEMFEKKAFAHKSKIIKISASLYAVPFYQRRGYKKTTGLRKLFRLKVQPMQKRLKC